MSERKNIIGVMTERESIEAFTDAAKKTAYHAREMATILEDPGWEEMAQMLEALGVNGKKLSQMKSMTRMETLMAANLKATPYNPRGS